MTHMTAFLCVLSKQSMDSSSKPPWNQLSAWSLCTPDITLLPVISQKKPFHHFTNMNTSPFPNFSVVVVHLQHARSVAMTTVTVAAVIYSLVRKREKRTTAEILFKKSLVMNWWVSLFNNVMALHDYWPDCVGLCHQRYRIQHDKSSMSCLSTPSDTRKHHNSQLTWHGHCFLICGLEMGRG